MSAIRSQNIELAIMSIDVAESSGFWGNQRSEKPLPSNQRQAAKAGCPITSAMRLAFRRRSAWNRASRRSAVDREQRRKSFDQLAINGVDEASLFVRQDERYRANEHSHCVRSAWSGSTAEARRAGT
jgi:hypothetical protein